ncbi:MAG TPA: hypothetical protein VJ731_00600 [Terriglobales bacterium]|nr:hypothetical protein [Terriglobales bacterium]
MKPNWRPLEEKLGSKRCAGFMFMGRINGINLYKHGIARMYLNLDDSGHCYVSGSRGFHRADVMTELAKLEAALRELGGTLESVYDEACIAKKCEALYRTGIPLIRFEVEPENQSIN